MDTDDETYRRLRDLGSGAALRVPKAAQTPRRGGY